MGNSFCSNCYAEGRAFAGRFLKRVAERNQWAVDDLTKAAELYTKAEEAMIVLAKAFPFEFTHEPVSDDAAIKDAIPALEAAKENEVKAIEILSKVAHMDWPRG